MRYRFSIVLDHRPGAVARVLAELEARDMEPEELLVSPLAGSEAGLARLTLVTSGGAQAARRATAKIGQQPRVREVRQEAAPERMSSGEGAGYERVL